MLGAVVFGATYTAGYLRWWRRLRSLPQENLGGIRLVRNSGEGPGTFANLIFLPGADVHPVILRHEMAHVRCGHFAELLAARILAVAIWPCLPIWWVVRELRLVHEQEADRVGSSGMNPRNYAALLLEGTLQSTPIIPQTFFLKPLKRRIVMLIKPQNSRAAVRATLHFFVAFALFSLVWLSFQNQPVLAFSTLPVPELTHASEQGAGDSVYRYVATMPEYKGDMNDVLRRKLVYPKRARKSKAEGKVIVRFVVGPDGMQRDVSIAKSSGNKALDQEALRVADMLDEWKPGRLEDGTLVSVSYYLPFTFTLQ